MRVQYDVMVQEFARVLEKKGFTHEDAENAAIIFAQNSLAGVYSHGLNRKIGNNPLIMAVPRSNGEHAMIDCAVSQFSYGKIEDCRLKGLKLPVPGGYDTKGELTTDTSEIEKTWRVLPMGYWKGSGLSIVLDLIATVLTDGNSVSKIGTFGDEIGLTQIMIAVDPTKFNTVEQTDAIVDEILADVKSSEPIKEDGEVLYPGELELKNIKEWW